MIFLLVGCDVQPKASAEQKIAVCNQTVYGTKKYVQHLPSYICIPDGFIIDDYVRISDLDQDGKNDFLAIKYNRKEDNQKDGDTTYWVFYNRSKTETLFKHHLRLANIVPSYIKNLSDDYLRKNPLAVKIFNEYPRRLQIHGLSFQLNKDTIRLSYKFEDSYGKSFVFIYNKSSLNWHLENIEYFIGELPAYWWREDNFYYPLNDRLKVIESRKPNQRVTISDFDLRDAFKYREDEWVHLAEWHIDNLDKSKWDSILKVKFKACQGLDLPSTWNY